MGVLVSAIVVGTGALLWRCGHPARNQDPLVPAGSEAIEGARSWIGNLVAAFDFSGTGRSAAFSGYVEADYVLVASTVGGTLMQLDVARGDRVAAGARLFALDDISERAARDEAAGKLRQAQAQFADLLTGRRPPEIDAIVAQRAQAEAALRHSEADYQRELRLRGTGASSTRQFDEARSQRDRDQSRLEELDAQMRIARMPGRDEQIRAAEAAVTAARASLAQAEWRLAQMTGTAPTGGMIVDTLARWCRPASRSCSCCPRRTSRSASSFRKGS
jgi:HlyD family secretion protein